MKGSRRKARADALQILYQLDLNHTLTPDAGIAQFEKCFTPGSEQVTEIPVDSFTRELVAGVTEKLADIRARIDAVSENWRTDRMAVVDRNLLRLGTYELVYRDEVPTTVTINEMVDLAKEFGSETSPAFVNGILDKIKSGIHNPNKAP